MASTQKLTLEIENEFNRLMAKSPNKLLMPEIVVATAASPTSPLHHYFTWDNNKAAENWRLQEARQLIQGYTIYNEQLDITVRALTSLDIDRQNGGGYRWTLETLERPSLREQMVETALRELQVIQNKYTHLQELSAVWDAVNDANSVVA